jgi:hypothetical protein
VGLPAEIILNKDKLTEINTFFGFETSLHLEYQFLHQFALYIEYGYQFIMTNSSLYPDKYFQLSNFQLGASLKLFKDKRYYYK